MTSGHNRAALQARCVLATLFSYSTSPATGAASHQLHSRLGPHPDWPVILRALIARLSQPTTVTYFTNHGAMAPNPPAAFSTTFSLYSCRPQPAAPTHPRPYTSIQTHKPFTVMAPKESTVTRTGSACSSPRDSPQRPCALAFPRGEGEGVPLAKEQRLRSRPGDIGRGLSRSWPMRD